MDDLKNTTHKDLENYYRKFYSPNNSTITVSGDVNPKEVYNMVKKYFGDYERKDIDRPDYDVPSQKEEKTLEIKKVTRVPIILMMHKIPQGNTKDVVALNATLDILINSQNSRLKEKLIREKRWVLQTGGITNELRSESFALTYLIPYNQQLNERVMKIYNEEIDNIINEGISEDELKTVKKKYIKNLILSMKNKEKTADYISQGALRYDNPDFYKKKLEMIKNLTVEDIQNATKEYLKKNNRTTGYVLPKQ